MYALADTVRDWLSYTAWEMEVPAAYGPLHLSFMLAGFAVSGLLAWKLRNVGERGNRRILLLIGLFLLVSEVYKQLMYEVVLEPEPGYRWGIFPFQLCSIPLYLCLLIPCLKPGRLQRSLYSFLMTYNLLGGFIAFFEPSGLLHAHWTLTMHALIWHMLLVFLGVYIAVSGRGAHTRRDYWDATTVFLILCAVAFGINCAFWQISEHQIKMFFVGPGNSPIIVFKQIAEAFGWYVSTVLYIPSVCVGAFGIFWLFRFWDRKKATPSPAATEITVKTEETV